MTEDQMTLARIEIKLEYLIGLDVYDKGGDYEEYSKILRGLDKAVEGSREVTEE